MAKPTTFISFTKLPIEIQQAIWWYCCEQEGRANARIQRIAKDPESRAKTLDDLPELRIVNQRRPAPTLLHVCRESRIIARRYWTRWRCADPVTYEDDRTGIYVVYTYVNKEHDMFYFADGLPKDFWFLSCFLGLNPDLDIGDKEREDIEEHFHDFIKGVRHFAMDWYCWLKATTYSDWTWMDHLDLNDKGDFTIVIKNRRNPGHLSEIPANFVPSLREVTPGTTRAKAVDAILTHIKYKEIGENFPLDTEIVKMKKEGDEDNCCVPMLKALAVVGPNDDENSEEDVEYLEMVTRQARYHRVKHDLRNLEYERRSLQREIEEMNVPFPQEGFGVISLD